MEADDKAAVIRFAESLPPHDLLFLNRDITKRPVVDAWIASNEDGSMTTLLAEYEGELVGCAALRQDPMSWSPHVGELRVLVAKGARKHGLGRYLIEQAFRVALDKDLEKLTARMTPDQSGAITVFEELGFRGEALLKDHVRDGGGDMHDIVVLACNVRNAAAHIEALGMGESAT
ncbi:MAG: GNAT family N-acetyltransferase [Sphingomonadaceae bacterium]|nr:GNAT family N-acetyltransferase [Sphingomonadaceae bacterium]